LLFSGRAARDAAYAPDNRDGSGGVWLMWNTMLGEGLIEYGYRAEAPRQIPTEEYFTWRDRNY
jgi:hypothetical protein